MKFKIKQSFLFSYERPTKSISGAENEIETSLTTLFDYCSLFYSGL